MAKSLSLIFWGLLLVFVDLRLDAFDALPDVVGYVLAAIGAGRLSGAAPGFRAAALVAAALVVPGLVDSVQPLAAGGLLGVVEILGQGALLWTLLTGIIVFTEEGGRPDLARRARRLRAAEVALAVVGLMLHLTSRSGAGVPGPVVFLAILNLVLLAMVLVLVRRVRGELNPEVAVPRSWRPSVYPRRV